MFDPTYTCAECGIEVLALNDAHRLSCRSMESLWKTQHPDYNPASDGPMTKAEKELLYDAGLSIYFDINNEPFA